MTNTGLTSRRRLAAPWWHDQVPRRDRGGLVNTHHRPSEEYLLALLDARHPGWKSDSEGWVTLERCGVAWRVHYRHGELLEVGWWGTLEHAQRARHRVANVAEKD